MEKRNIVMQLLGCLMQNPLFLGEVNSYNLTPNDFSRSMDKQIFAAIYNLFSGGAEKITVMDVDNYLKGHPAIYADFVKNNGIEYLQDAEDFGIVENFNYYYATLKKYNAIKDLQKEGFDTKDIYPTDALDPHQEDKLKKFDMMTVQMIFDQVRNKLAKIEGDYGAGTNTKTCFANEGLEALLDGLSASPEIGANLPGDSYNTIVRGARKGKFYLQSSGTGVGKTRRMVGECCYIAYPVRYDWSRKQWEKRGSCEKVLYVGTEQTISEIQTLILAYLSGINEEKILYGRYNDEEKIVLEQTLKVMEIYQENFTIAQLPDPTIQLVRSVIRKECLLKEIDYVFYDYIFSSPGLLSEFRDLRIREDVVLGMLSTALKDLAVELDVFMRSATQVNGDLQEIKGIRDQRCIRGAKAIADKIDCGMVTAKVSPEELVTLDKVIRERGICPNQVSDIYKLRRGRYNDVRIWSEMDLGTCRIKDLFVTDVNFKPILDFYPITFTYDECDDDIQSILGFLNNRNDVPEIEKEVVITNNDEELSLESVNKTSINNWVF
jgi:replicative DNA helicase